MIVSEGGIVPLFAIKNAQDLPHSSYFTCGNWAPNLHIVQIGGWPRPYSVHMQFFVIQRMYLPY